MFLEAKHRETSLTSVLIEHTEFMTNIHRALVEGSDGWADDTARRTKSTAGDFIDSTVTDRTVSKSKFEKLLHTLKKFFKTLSKNIKRFVKRTVRAVDVTTVRLRLLAKDRTHPHHSSLVRCLSAIGELKDRLAGLEKEEDRLTTALAVMGFNDDTTENIAILKDQIGAIQLELKFSMREYAQVKALATQLLSDNSLI